MPKVSVGRDRLFKALGRSNYTKDEFEDLCMRYGLELDDVTTEKAIIRKEMHLGDEEATEDEEVIYIVEVPAHRYDLLCLEGLVQALRIFMELDEIPTYTVANVPKESMLKVHVKPETSSIRPFIVCAVLRGITFDEARYKSFIDLQDKLHQNVCRKRTLVAIGTHDLDTLQGPFTYEALLPTEIDFVPLKQEKSFRADELMKFYESDTKLKKFLHIIEKSPVFPVIYDSKRTVLSLPPIINGAHSAITLQTKNVLIECTATDLTKAEIVLKTMVTMFSMYCEHKFEVEPVEVVGTSVKFYPDLSTSNMEVPLSEVTSKIGVSAEATQVISCLKKMQLRAVQGLSGDKECKIVLSIPPTRTDILQSCDVAENFAIAYGFNNITRTMPKIPTQGRHQLLSQISYLIRLEIALAGFTEVLTWILCSNKENFSMLDRKDEKSTAVIVGNPRSSDFESHLRSTERAMLRVSGKVKLSISTMSRIRVATEKNTKKTAQAIVTFKNQLSEFVNVVVSSGALQLPLPQPSPQGVLESNPQVGSTITVTENTDKENPCAELGEVTEIPAIGAASGTDEGMVVVNMTTDDPRVSPIRALAGSTTANGGFVATGNEDFDADFGKVLNRGLVGSFPRVQGELKIEVLIGETAGLSDKSYGGLIENYEGKQSPSKAHKGFHILTFVYQILIFEVGDVVLLDKGKDIGATNRRRIAALYSGEDSGFEIIYALVLRVLQMLNIPCKPTEGYSIAASSEPEFLPDRQANVTLKGKYVGTFGIVHPEVISPNDVDLSWFQVVSSIV
ncbi:hypothetical protein GIB67_036685 [Kingdonia uniflora]|uniref:phenylalanine--tRNA ligase n=1 Tax=Kingdonia uniflora TaxID=39325 RepID=A0A7J7LWD7_9MAGN|nr:hypothetical protein GIB67_036685 [Kingdonia uniflora]